MKKVLDFLKSYKKILIVSLIGLIIVTAISIALTVFGLRGEISKCNNAQLPKIYEKSKEIKELFGWEAEQYRNKAGQDDKVLENLIELDEASADIYRSISANYEDDLAVKELYDNMASAGGTPEEIIWRISERCVGVDINSYFAAVNSEDGTVIYSDIPSLNDTKITKVDSKADEYITDDKKYVAQCYDVPEGSVRLLALTPTVDFYHRCIEDIVLIIAIFLAVLVILVSYIACLRQAELDPTQEYKVLGKYFLHTQTKRFRALAIVIGIAVALAYIVLVSISNSKYDMRYLNLESAKCVEAMELCGECASTLNEGNDETYYYYGRLVREFLNRNPEYLNKDGMTKLARALYVTHVSVFDADGNMLCTSSPMDHLKISDNPENSMYELNYALMGKEGVTVKMNPEVTGENVSLYAVPWRNSEGVADGIVALSDDDGELHDYLAECDSMVEVSRNRAGSQVFLVDSYGVILTDAATTADILQVDESALRDGYCGDIVIDGCLYLTSVSYIESIDKYIFVITPANQLKRSTIIKYVIIMILYIILALCMWYDGLGSKYRFEKRENKVKDADDWQREELYWDELTVGQKMSKIFSICIYVLSAAIVIATIMAKNRVLNDGLVTTITSGNWKNSFNLYSLVANICIIMLFYSGIKLVGYILKKLECIMGEDGVTFTRLFTSLIKYIGAIVCAFIVIMNFGVDAKAALASIGIVGFGLTFGAQELIKDMIAGMFILFEGNYKVGDMLDVSGDWYWVKSIGVRTTRLEAWGSVKVINNSKMTGVVNIQNSSAVVNCDVMISNEYDIREIESYMRAELPALKEQLSADVSTPTWKGIQEIKAAGTVIRMRTYCPPLSQGWVGRLLRREVKNILERHGVQLAYDALVIHSDAVDPEKLKEEIIKEHFESEK